MGTVLYCVAEGAIMWMEWNGSVLLPGDIHHCPEVLVTWPRYEHVQLQGEATLTCAHDHQFSMDQVGGTLAFYSYLKYLCPAHQLSPGVLPLCICFRNSCSGADNGIIDSD